MMRVILSMAAVLMLSVGGPAVADRVQVVVTNDTVALGYGYRAPTFGQRVIVVEENRRQPVGLSRFNGNLGQRAPFGGLVDRRVIFLPVDSVSPRSRHGVGRIGGDRIGRPGSVVDLLRH
ncbi:MAG: hypothetical protein AAF919_01060 [Pseudomonadota bacterium]